MLSNNFYLLYYQRVQIYKKKLKYQLFSTIFLIKIVSDLEIQIKYLQKSFGIFPYVTENV